MKRALVCAAACACIFVLTGCPGPRSDRWEQQREAWPEDRATGGTPTEARVYLEAKDGFEETLAEEHASAEH